MNARRLAVTAAASLGVFLLAAPSALAASSGTASLKGSTVTCSVKGTTLSCSIKDTLADKKSAGLWYKVQGESGFGKVVENNAGSGKTTQFSKQIKKGSEVTFKAVVVNLISNDESKAVFIK